MVPRICAKNLRRMYLTLTIPVFILGFILTMLPPFEGILKIPSRDTKNPSIFLGGLFAGVWLLLWMVVDYYYYYYIGKGLRTNLDRVVFLLAVFLPFVLLIFDTHSVFSEERILQGYAFSSLFAAINTFFLGKNTEYKKNEKVDPKMMSFLALILTLISIMSIAISFVGGTRYTTYKDGFSISVVWLGPVQRAAVFGIYCLMSIVIYSIGILTKIMNHKTAHSISLFLIVFLGFSMGMIAADLLKWCKFASPASILAFLVIGYSLELREELKMCIMNVVHFHVL